MILLDTNTIVHYLKGRESVVSRFRAASPRELALPAIVLYELECGAQSASSVTRRAVIAALLEGVAHIPFDADAAIAAAKVRVDLEARGAIIGPLDILIAGTALSRGATLVTNNTREFSRIRGLRLDDWTK